MKETIMSIEGTNRLINKRSISKSYGDNIEKAYRGKASILQIRDLVYRVESDAFMSIESREILQEFVKYLANIGGSNNA